MNNSKKGNETTTTKLRPISTKIVGHAEQPSYHHLPTTSFTALSLSLSLSLYLPLLTIIHTHYLMYDHTGYCGGYCGG